MRDREERARMSGKQCLLLAEVLGPHRENRPGRWLLVAEPPDVGLAERPLPRECLARHVPGAIAVPFAFGHLRQRGSELFDIMKGRHSGHGTCCHGEMSARQPSARHDIALTSRRDTTYCP